MKSVTYRTSGTCSQAIRVDVEGGVVKDVEFIGGCAGNTAGLAALVRGRSVEDVVKVLRGIECRNGTSCPDQLAKALQTEFL